MKNARAKQLVRDYCATKVVQFDQLGATLDGCFEFDPEDDFEGDLTHVEDAVIDGLVNALHIASALGVDETFAMARAMKQFGSEEENV